MDTERKNNLVGFVIAGGLIVAVILALGTMWMGNSARRDTVKAVRSVSLLYMDELAGRREQVVENNLNDNIRVINIALDMINEDALSDLEHMRMYQRNVKQLFDLERFAFVDDNGLIYTADEGIVDELDQYSFDYKTLSEPEISVKDLENPEKKVIIAVPIRDRNLYLEGKQLTVCFMEIDMEVMLQGASLKSQSSGATFCNLYTSDGTALSNTVLGGLAVEDNLLEALSRADYEEGYSYEQVAKDFSEGNRGNVSFNYDGFQETLSYVPVSGTDWFLTYLIRESVISDRISPVTEEIVLKSLVQSILTVLVLAMIFSFLIIQLRRNAKLTLEKETAETENRIKHQELEQRLALQQQLLEQKAEQEQQEKMITALASDYRSVYYIELDTDQGVCYQARDDLDGFKVGEKFAYMESVTAYCNKYILEEYREEFLSFIQPDAIRESLKESQVISYVYKINVGGKESYEAVRFAGVSHPGDSDDRLVHNVGACFMDVDAETRKSIEQRQALSEALAEAEQASKAKTVFLSNMSHEIRTPMNAIIGLNNIMLNEPDLPDKVRTNLQKTSDSAHHLLGIINDILDMSRIESGRMVVKNEEFSFAKNLEQVNAIISGQCRDKGITYECRTIGNIDDSYVGDGGKLKQIMINILGNSVKFTPEGGTVTFLIEEGRRYEGKAVLKMIFKDTGVGISPEFMPHLFDSFAQEDSFASNQYGSTGLGLALTKNFVELMNGRIEVESEKGVGTTFTVTVPLGESQRKDGTEKRIVNLENMSALVIDDDPIALEHAQIVLGQVGMSCDTASSGPESVEKVKLHHARREDYDLILVDWKMPEQDGVETTRQIREIVGKDTPIIILTSYNWDDVFEEAKDAGVDSFVPKPLFAGNVMDEFQHQFKKKTAAQNQAKADLTGRHILLAEDIAVNAEIMKMVLSMKEIESDTAENGRIAVDKYVEHPEGYYDAILMDIQMPEMNGLEATRAIRASGHGDAETIPIIALTANAFDEDVQRSMQAGMNAHLSKPVDPDILFSTLESLIGQRESIMESGKGGNNE